MARIIDRRSLGRALAGTGALVLTLALAGTASYAGGGRVDQPTLTGFATLPAATFVPGSESSGSLITGNTNGHQVPCADQPVQGFSGFDYPLAPCELFLELEHTY